MGKASRTSASERDSSLLHMAEGGLLALETGIGQADAIKAMASKVSLHGQSVEDLSERPRFFFAS